MQSDVALRHNFQICRMAYVALRTKNRIVFCEKTRLRYFA